MDQILERLDRLERTLARIAESLDSITGSESRQPDCDIVQRAILLIEPHNGNKAAIARELGITRTVMYQRKWDKFNAVCNGYPELSSSRTIAATRGVIDGEKVDGITNEDWESVDQ